MCMLTTYTHYINFTSFRFGRKWAFLGSLAIKTLGNLMSTLATNYPVFVVGRFITGAGGMGAGVSVYVLSKWTKVQG
jgi:predicted MFS family arabinose efflux permease